jgi:ABC-type multidrug transport system ATPase subunit
LLLDAVTGLYPTKGVECSIDGRPIMHLNLAARYGLGLRRTFQDPQAPGDVLVAEILEPVQVGEREKLALVLPVLAAASIELRDVRRFGQLSFGQKKIVDLIHAAISARVLLLDEPFAGLSEKAREQLAIFLRHIVVGFGMACLMVEHLHDSYALSEHSTVLQSSTGRAAVAPAKVKAIELSRSSASVPSLLHWHLSNLVIGSQEVVRRLDVRMRPGTVILIAGANGSGKSTLARHLALLGYQADYSTLSSFECSQKSRVHYSPQPPKLINQLTARENLTLMNTRSTDELMKTLSDGMGFSGMDYRVEMLSGGEASIAALIGALCAEADLLVLDEPLASLAPEAAELAQVLMIKYLDAGGRIILVSHEAHIINGLPPTAKLYLAAGQAFEGTLEGVTTRETLLCS